LSVGAINHHTKQDCYKADSYNDFLKCKNQIHHYKSFINWSAVQEHKKHCSQFHPQLLPKECYECKSFPLHSQQVQCFKDGTNKYFGSIQRRQWLDEQQFKELERTLYHKYPEKRIDLCTNPNSSYSKMCDAPHWIEYSFEMYTPFLTSFLVREQVNYFISTVFTLLTFFPFVGFMMF
jgi:hypothetical protein